MKLKELIAIPYSNDNGLLQQMEVNNWFDDLYLRAFFENLDVNVLDLIYLGRSGNKEISTYIDPYLDNPDFMENPLAYLYKMVGHFYLNKWSKLTKDFLLEYDLLKPYNVNETENVDMTYDENNRTNTNVTTTDNGKIEDSRYGFNSSSSVKTDDSSDQNTSTTTGSEDDNYELNNRTEQGTKTHTKQGNLGALTAPDLIKKDISLWQNNLIEIIFQDMDKLLTCPLYSY